MMVHILRENGKVTGTFARPLYEGQTLVTEEVADNHPDVLAFRNPPPSTDPTDYPLNSSQFFTFLDRIGLSEAAVDAAIDSVEPNPNKRIEHKRRFRHASSYHRDNPLLVSLIPAVGKTPAQIDAAWMQAKDLK